jgi:hypothetical protein
MIGPRRPALPSFDLYRPRIGGVLRIGRYLLAVEGDEMTDAQRAHSEPQPRFVDILRLPAARDSFAAWRAARRDGSLPLLFDFAPLHLPPAVLPWVLIQRLLRTGELVYGLAGEELVQLFGENPKGKPALEHVEPDERAKRIGLINEVITKGLPIWYLGTLLLENRQHIPVGRLVLPATDEVERLVVIIYFLLRVAPALPLRLVSRPNLDAGQLYWCSPADLED